MLGESQLVTVPAVVALAGRRVDADGADPPRFPLRNVPLVQERLATLLAAEGATALVCSAACGADLVALEVAERLGLRRRVVLPFPPERFRRISVADRPGDWGPVFDRLVAVARAAGDLVVLGCDDDNSNGETAYAAANQVIVREAQALARTGDATQRLLAVVVWEGTARAGSDATEGFRRLAVAAGIDERSIPTC